MTASESCREYIGKVNACIKNNRITKNSDRPVYGTNKKSHNKYTYVYSPKVQKLRQICGENWETAS